MVHTARGTHHHCNELRGLEVVCCSIKRFWQSKLEIAVAVELEDIVIAPMLMIVSLAHSRPLNFLGQRSRHVRKVDEDCSMGPKFRFHRTLAELSRIAEKRPPPHSTSFRVCASCGPLCQVSRDRRQHRVSIRQGQPQSQKWCVAATTAGVCVMRAELTEQAPTQKVSRKSDRIDVARAECRNVECVEV